MRFSDDRPGVAGRWILIALTLSGAPAAASAQTTTPQAPSVTTTPQAPSVTTTPQAPSVTTTPQAPSVIVPHAGIDPGMRIKPPRLPPGSTPVIKPRTTPSPGSRTVVVPK